MHLASVTSLDTSANSDDDIGDLDDTGINEELTVNMEEADGTIDIMVDNETAELAVTKDKAS